MYKKEDKLCAISLFLKRGNKVCTVAMILQTNN